MPLRRHLQRVGQIAGLLAAKLGQRARERARTQFDWPVLFRAHELEIEALLG